MLRSKARRRAVLVDAAFLVPALAVAYVLKRHYSEASPEALSWVLEPTAALVGLVMGAPFTAEAGVGYVSRELQFAIAPSCAGINFLIVAFLSLVCGLLPAVEGLPRKVALFAGAALCALVATLIANTIRIVVAIYLHQGDFSIASLSREELHRIEGAAVYCFFLCAIFVGARALVLRRSGARHAG